MKHALLTACLVAILSNCYSQQTDATGELAAKFISFYNEEKPDSLHTLVSDEVKKGLPLGNVITVIRQLKGQFGKLLTSEFAGTNNGVETYICTFEKSGPVLYLHFDSNRKIAGFFVNADKRVHAPSVEEEQQVSFNTRMSVLKGTLSVPKISGKMPVVLLITGSGPTDRNGNSLLIQGKPNYFLKISNALRANNIAVLRYDKRGIGQSTTTKSEAESTFDDMVDDAAVLIRFLKNDSRFSKVIVAGHSEGSLVGILASERGKADGFISLAGAGLPISKVLKSQFKEVLSPDDYKTATAVLDSIKAGEQIKQSLKNGLEVHFRPSIRPYLRSWMKYDPRAELSKLKVPVLVVQGTHDIQVNVENARQLKKSKPQAKLVLIDGMNHILKAAPADRQQNLATYLRNDLELHPKLIDELTQFIREI